MKWGNVFHYYLCCHIYYCILYNKKANEKPEKKTEPNRGNTIVSHPLSVVYLEKSR